MVFCDNKSVIQLATNPASNERTKHVDIDCHFIRQHVNFGFLNLIHLPSNQQLADVLTKALLMSKFTELIFKLGVLDIYLLT